MTDGEVTTTDARLEMAVLENTFTGQRIVLREDPEIAAQATMFRGTDGVLGWESQVVQYDASGPAGISYFAGEVGKGLPPVDCLLYRGTDGGLLGILNHYAVDYPPFEKAGNVLVLVHPEHRRSGIGMALMLEALDRWDIDPDQQKYSRGGIALVKKFLTTRGFKEMK